MSCVVLCWVIAILLQSSTYCVLCLLLLFRPYCSKNEVDGWWDDGGHGGVGGG